MKKKKTKTSLGVCTKAAYAAKGRVTRKDMDFESNANHTVDRNSSNGLTGKCKKGCHWSEVLFIASKPRHKVMPA